MLIVSKHARLSILFSLVSLPAIALLGIAGCDSSSQRFVPALASGAQATREGGRILLDNAVDTLFQLEERVTTDLTRLISVVNSAKTLDEEDAMATVTAHPGFPEPRYNVLEVRAENTRFVNADREQDRVLPGDIARFYIGQDEFGRDTYREFNVVEVLNDFTLAVDVDFGQPVFRPYKLEIWRHHGGEFQRAQQLAQRWARTGRPSLGWEPLMEQKMLDDILVDLNQWARGAPPIEWKATSLLESLPVALRDLDYVRSLGRLAFDPYDARLLQETVWLRNIARQAMGNALTNLERARRLFDWTVRNIQLVDSGSPTVRAQRPWHALIYGQGTAEQRAWVFALLGRQAYLDIVMLGLPKGDEEREFWLPALLDGEELYLFDSRLGIPIAGESLDSVATLSQAAQKADVLGRLDLPQRPYWVHAGDCQKVTALVEASPHVLSRRMRLLDSQLSGDRRLVLFVDADGLAERLTRCRHVAEVRLWTLPYETMREAGQLSPAERSDAAFRFIAYRMVPVMWKARLLHFKGVYDKNEEENVLGAKYFYLQARPSQAQLRRFRLLPSQSSLFQGVKVDASYWLGTIALEHGGYEVARDFFENRVVRDWPDSNRVEGARYLLGRTLEAMGRPAEAAAIYDSIGSGPQGHGNLLRARQLRENGATATAEVQ